MIVKDVLENLKKLRIIPLANNQNIIVASYEGARYYLFLSYDTLIAIYNTENYDIAVNTNKWDYSKTTMRWLKTFINDYTARHYDNKQQFAYFIYNDVNDGVTRFSD